MPRHDLPDDHGRLRDGAPLAGPALPVEAEAVAEVPELRGRAGAVPVSVRPATEADLPAILELGRQMAAEAPRWRDMPYLPEKAELLTRASIEQGGAWVAEADSGLAGMLVGLLAQHWFSSTWYAGTLAVYVAPAFRGTGVFPALLWRFEEWGAQRGAEEWCVGVHTGFADDALAGLYRRLGYSDAGINLVKRVLVPARADG